MLFIQVYIWFLLFCSLGTNSLVGYHPIRGCQFIKLGQGSRKKDIIVAILLTLGKGREHLREDRDKYIYIFWNNIEKGEAKHTCILVFNYYKIHHSFLW